MERIKIVNGRLITPFRIVENGTLLIDQTNLANLFPLATTLRFDYFGVWGDVNTNAVILAPNGSASAMEVYKWVISGGIVGAPTVIRLDNATVGTYFTGIESLGGNPHVFPVAADKFYVDGGGTYPTLETQPLRYSRMAGRR